MNDAHVRMTWKWCSKCPRREVQVVRWNGNRFMGFDRCGEVDGTMYVNPSMDVEVGTWCPFYAEAFVEQENGGDSSC